MSMSIVNNMMALNAQRQFGIVGLNKSKSTEKLSSGYKINRAADDAAGLAISEKMRRQIRGLTQGTQNCQDGISFNQIADGAMNEVSDMLHRMEELAVKAANGTNTDEDRSYIQLEIEQLKDEINRISERTTFNEIPVFGRERSIGEYNVNDSGDKEIIVTSSYYVEGNKYGITEVLGEDHIYGNRIMNNPLKMDGSGWVSTGEVTYGTSLYGSKLTVDELANKINVLTSDAYIPGIIKTAIWGGGKGEISDPKTGDDGYVYSISISRSGAKDLTGNYLADTLVVNKGTYEVPGDESTYKLISSTKYYLQSSVPGASGINDGTTYGSAWLDFSGLGTDYSLEDLYGQGFNSTCTHGCGKHYSISFTDDSLGAAYKYSGNNLNPVLKVNISGCSTGEDIVKSVIDAVNDNEPFRNHWQQCAYNTNEPAKLYLYDNTKLGSGYGATFEPVSRSEDGKMVINKTVVHIPGTQRVKEYADKDIWIQSGTEANDGFYIKRAVIGGDYLGTDTINVENAESSQSAIEIIKSANTLLNEQRAMVGAQQNRLEHTINNQNNVVENTTASESAIRDTDMATEMVKYSNHNILEQVGQSMLAQANQSNNGILSLLS